MISIDWLMFWQPSRSEPRFYGFALNRHDAAEVRVVIYLCAECAPADSGECQGHMQDASSGFLPLFSTGSPSDDGQIGFSSIEQAISAAVTHSVQGVPEDSERDRLRLHRLKEAMKGTVRAHRRRRQAR